MGHKHLGHEGDSTKFGKTTIASMEIYNQQYEEQYTSHTEAASIYLRVVQPFLWYERRSWRASESTCSPACLWVWHWLSQVLAFLPLRFFPGCK